MRARDFTATPTSALAKSAGSNGRRSSSSSPIPISLTGRPSSRAIAIATPPRALPSSFVSTIPSTAAAAEKSSAWRSPFWPVRRVDHEQRLVRRALDLAGDHAAHLLELGHQRLLVVQPPRGVDQRDVVAAGARPRDRLERDRAGVGPGLAGDDVGARALRPALELLARRGAERVGGAEQHAQPETLAKLPRELAQRGRLPGAVDPDDQDDGGLRPQVDRGRRIGAGTGDLARGSRRAARGAGRRRAGRGAPRTRARRRRRPPWPRRGRRRSAPPRAPRGRAPSSEPPKDSRVARRLARRRRNRPRRRSVLLLALLLLGLGLVAKDEEVAPLAGHQAASAATWARGRRRQGGARRPSRCRRRPSTRRRASRRPPSCASGGSRR